MTQTETEETRPLFWRDEVIHLLNSGKDIAALKLLASKVHNVTPYELHDITLDLAQALLRQEEKSEPQPD